LISANHGSGTQAPGFQAADRPRPAHRRSQNGRKPVLRP
jgi:hypothetical protein